MNVKEKILDENIVSRVEHKLLVQLIRYAKKNNCTRAESQRKALKALVKIDDDKKIDKLLKMSKKEINKLFI